ncbi:hypothetical protein [Terriglobus aquaticus]|uniref:hypothetical protein n=1 Tax=Terriglobus aquaticus TaxID=940139 RepID=UPI0021E09D95|nr:hypothetical protein [Terriglobus aquaticus]
MRTLLYPAVLLSFLAPVACSGAKQSSEPAVDIRALMRDVCHEEIQVLQRHDSRLRYQVHREDRHGTTVRDQIESHDGGVARLLQHNGQTLTVEENAGEQQRLKALLGTNKLQQREREEAHNRTYGTELLEVMPDAMQFAAAPEQTPVPDVPDRQIVVNFDPNPAFHPANMAQQILPALHGRAWIDLNDHRLLRMELRNSSDVNLAWGLLAKVYAGGSILYEQRRVQDISTFTHIVMHLRVRELMLKTVQMDTDTRATDFQRLASSPSGDDAIRMLLSETVPTR